MGIKILGISTSLRRNSNTGILVNKALEGACAIADTQAEFLDLFDKNITPCDGCDICCEHSLCKYEKKDDFEAVYAKMMECDGLILGSPVYYGTVCCQCKALMDRCYKYDMISTQNKRQSDLRMKVGGAIAVASGRHAGQEQTLQAIHTFFHFCEIIPVSIIAPHSQLGATGNAHRPGQVIDDAWDLWAAKRRTSSLEMAWMLGRKVAILAAVVKAGRQLTGLDYLDSPYGSNMPITPYVETGCHRP